MKLIVELESNEIDSPIRFATAIIEHCINFNPDNFDLNYRYLNEVNEHIDIFLKNIYSKGSDSE